MSKVSKKTLYSRFKTAVLEAAFGMCECTVCDGDADQVHHFFKQSTYPEFKYDPDNGMACCGSCHAEIERRIREGEDWLELIPLERYKVMEDKIAN